MNKSTNGGPKTFPYRTYLLISRNRLLDIKNSISWYQEFNFLISRIIFLHIKQWILEFLISGNQIPYIKKFLKNSKTAPQKTFLDIKKFFLYIKKLFLDIRNSMFWYQEMCIISWYREIECLIWRNAFLDIRKCISGYPEIEFLISRNAEWIVKRRLIQNIDGQIYELPLVPFHFFGFIR